MTRQENFGDSFWYMTYFQRPDVAESELEAYIRRSLRTIYFMTSGDVPAKCGQSGNLQRKVP